MPECAAGGCTVQVHPSKLMCAHDWAAVPPALQRDVLRTYRAWMARMGDADLMAAYQAAKHAAVQAV